MKNLFFIIIGILLISASFTLQKNQLLPTNLRITVLDNLGNVQQGVTVALYKTENNYREEKNPITDKKVTDKKGRVTFKKIDPMIYYIHAIKGELNNDGGGVQTDTLISGKLNKVNVIIE